MQIALSDATLECELLGDGPTLLTLHGGMGFDHSCFRPWLDPLADTFEVVYFDQRGGGRTTSRLPSEAITHATWADDADALCAELGRDDVVVLGHSYGAFLALELALRHPQRVRALVLASASAVIDYPEIIGANVQRLGTPDAIAAFGGSFGRPMGSVEELRALFLRILPLYFHRYDPKVGAAMAERMRFGTDGYNAAMRALQSYNVLPRLSEIRVPTLIIAGRHDFLMPMDRAAERLRDGISGSELVVLEEAGHFSFIEQPNEFLSAIRRWYRAL